MILQRIVQQQIQRHVSKSVPVFDIPNQPVSPSLFPSSTLRGRFYSNQNEESSHSGENQGPQSAKNAAELLTTLLSVGFVAGAAYLLVDQTGKSLDENQKRPPTSHSPIDNLNNINVLNSTSNVILAELSTITGQKFDNGSIVWEVKSHAEFDVSSDTNLIPQHGLFIPFRKKVFREAQHLLIGSISASNKPIKNHLIIEMVEDAGGNYSTKQGFVFSTPTNLESHQKQSHLLHIAFSNSQDQVGVNSLNPTRQVTSLVFSENEQLTHQFYHQLDHLDAAIRKISHTDPVSCPPFHLLLDLYEKKATADTLAESTYWISTYNLGERTAVPDSMTLLLAKNRAPAFSDLIEIAKDSKEFETSKAKVQSRVFSELVDEAREHIRTKECQDITAFAPQPLSVLIVTGIESRNSSFSNLLHEFSDVPDVISLGEAREWMKISDLSFKDVHIQTPHL